MRKNMSNALKRVMGAVMVVALLVGVLAVPTQNAQAVAPKTKNLIIPKGQSFGLSNSYGYNEDEKWSSSNTKVAKVDEGGWVTGKKVGKAVISLKTGGKTHKVKVTVVAKVTKKDATKIKAGKKQVSPLAKYGKYQYAVAFYTKNNKNFKGTLRDIKINSSLNQVVNKYGNIDDRFNEVGNKKCLQKITNKYEKELLKKMKISGVVKKYTVSYRDGNDVGDGNSLVLYFNKSNKVKAVLVAKNYLILQDAMMMAKEEGGRDADIKIKGNVLYKK